MTQTEELPAIEERLLLSGIGRKDLNEAFTVPSIEQFAHRLGMRSLNRLIAMVLAEHYSADIFPADGVLYPAWGGEHGGDDIDPGVKWIACLRLALEVVNAERK